MHLRHRARTAGLVVACALAATPVGIGQAADRVAPVSGVLYIGTATEDGASAGPVSIRVGAGGTTLVSLLGGHFHGDLCAQDIALFAGPGSVDPGTISLDADGKFTGTQVRAAPDGARIAGTLKGRFAADAATASALLTYSDSPISGTTPCTVTATLALHRAPVPPVGKVTQPRPSTAYHAVTHQGWAATVVTDRSGRSASLVQVAAWNICHYQALPAVHFLYPEQIKTAAAIAHGKLSTRVTYTGGSGKVTAAVTGQFVGPGHHLYGALHITRSGTIGGNAFTCDTQRVLFSAP